MKSELPIALFGNKWISAEDGYCSITYRTQVCGIKCKIEYGTFGGHMVKAIGTIDCYPNEIKAWDINTVVHKFKEILIALKDNLNKEIANETII